MTPADSRTRFYPTEWNCVAVCFGILSIIGVLLFAGGCGSFRTKTSPYGSFGSTTQIQNAQNPLTIGNRDPFEVWETVVDVTRLYFDKIEDEYPCQRSGNAITEGLLKTKPQIGSTCFEPWRRDSCTADERQYATVQSVRRTAKIRVRFTDGNYIIHVRVDKELEDLAKPSYSVLPSATFRLDTQIPDTNDPIAVQDYNEGWIPLGRDYALEQQMLNQLQQRLDAML